MGGSLRGDGRLLETRRRFWCRSKGYIFQQDDNTASRAGMLDHKRGALVIQVDESWFSQWCCYSKPPMCSCHRYTSVDSPTAIHHVLTLLQLILQPRRIGVSYPTTSSVLSCNVGRTLVYLVFLLRNTVESRECGGLPPPVTAFGWRSCPYSIFKYNPNPPDISFYRIPVLALIFSGIVSSDYRYSNHSRASSRSHAYQYKSSHDGLTQIVFTTSSMLQRNHKTNK